MAQARQSAGDGGTKSWHKIDRVVMAFEQAWRSGKPPAIDDYLHHAGEERPALLRELVLVDLERRLKAGETARVEAYLQRFEALAAEPPCMLDLIALEYEQRCRQEAAATVRAEILERFPQYRQALAACLVGEDRAGHGGVLAGDAPAATEGNTLAAEAPAGPPADALVGRRLGPYLIQERVGSGGMGTVYRALRQADYRQQVAVKVILSGLDSDEIVPRFQTERQVLAELEHAHIARLFDGGVTDDGRPYFVMEYIDGQPLDRYCDRHQLNTEKRLRLLQGVCQAAQHAHERGVVHRDLKPGNILVTADGIPKVTDFGLAKRMEGEPGALATGLAHPGADAPGSPQGAPASPARTHTGAVLGTPSYMAPEQARGKPGEVGPATDVYALGAILYELLTGRPPFRAEAPLDTLHQVLHDEPVPPSHLKPKVPRDLQTICLKCLQKEPGKRYASAAALAEDLERFLRGESIRARPVGRVERLWRWCRRKPLAAGLCAALAVSLLAGTAVSLYLLGLMPEQTQADADTLFMRGRLHLERKEYHQAIAALSEAIRHDPRYVIAYVYRARVFKSQGKYDKAMDDCIAAMRLDRRRESACIAEAVSANNRGEYPLALRACQAVLQVNERSLDAFYIQSNARAMLRQWDLAASDYVKAAALGRLPRTSVLFTQAGCLLAAGDRVGYRKLCARMMKLTSTVQKADEQCHIARTCLLSVDSGISPAEMVRLAQRVVKSVRTPWLLHALGLAHYRSGQFELAIQRLHEVQWRARPTSWLILAMAHHRLGHASEAYRWLDWACQEPFPYVHPHEAMAYQLLRREAEALIPADPNRDAIRKEMATFQGTWKFVSYQITVRKGAEWGVLKDTEKYTWIFRGSHWTGLSEGKIGTDHLFALDPTQNPKIIDFLDTDQGTYWRGIYSLKGHTLTICDRKFEDGERPTEFLTRPDSGRVLFVMKRVKGKGDN
jgi:uncharacterized protein (TIGR03067 family)